LTIVCVQAALELAFVDSASVGSRSGINAHAITPVQVEIGVPSIRAANGCRAGSRALAKRQTVKACSTILSLVSILAALELAIIDREAIGSRECINAHSILPIKVVVGIPGINSTDRSRRCSRALSNGKIVQASSGSLVLVKFHAAFDLRVVRGDSVGSRGRVDTQSNGVVEVEVRVPNIRPSDRSGGRSGRVGQHAKTLARCLVREVILAALKLGGNTSSAAGVGVCGGAPSRIVIASVSWIVQNG
jgi:hypothetical protein